MADAGGAGQAGGVADFAKRGRVAVAADAFLDDLHDPALPVGELVAGQVFWLRTSHVRPPASWLVGATLLSRGGEIKLVFERAMNVFWSSSICSAALAVGPPRGGRRSRRPRGDGTGPVTPWTSGEAVVCGGALCPITVQAQFVHEQCRSARFKEVSPIFVHSRVLSPSR